MKAVSYCQLRSLSSREFLVSFMKNRIWSTRKTNDRSSFAKQPMLAFKRCGPGASSFRLLHKQPKQHHLSRPYSRSRILAMEGLKRPSSPILRTASPYSNPRVAGPRSQQLSSFNSTNNFHSTSLRNLTMVSTVNKTSLHPGGVQ